MEILLRAGLANAVSAAGLAVIVGALGLLLSRRPAVMHCLWFLVLLKLVTPPLFELPIPGRQPAEEPPRILSIVGLEPVVCERPGSDALLEWHPVEQGPETMAVTLQAETSANQSSTWAFPWSILGWVWAAGTILTLGLAAHRIVRFQYLLRRAEPADDDIQELVKELAGELGSKRSPAVWWIDETVSPMIWAPSLRPMLILPRALWKGLDSRQRSMLLVHELAHLRRGDHFLRFFELAVTALYWWHPAAWWARRALRDAEEQCCDAWVVWAFPEDARTYAETLLDTVDFLNPQRTPEPALASGFGKVHHLRRRLTMIMQGTTPRTLTRGGALGAFALAALLLPMSPSWAQKPEAEREIVIVTDDAPAGVLNLTESPRQEKSEYKFVFKTDDQIDVISADSIEQAIARLKDAITATPDSLTGEKSKARLNALRKALTELESSRAKAKMQEAMKGADVKQDQRIFIRKFDGLDVKKLSPEKQAEIEKINARIARLNQELAAKQKELSEAAQDLAKLQGMTFNVPGPKIFTTRVFEVGPKGDHLITENIHPSNSAVTLHGTVSHAESHAESHTDSKESHRLEVLEKKLEKLLDEVADLKKQGK